MTTREVKRRRPKGTGSIHQRSNGTWCGQVDLGWATGSRRRRTVYGTTREDVEALIALVLSRPAGEREALLQRHPTDDHRPWLELMREADARATHTVEQWEAKLAAVGCCVYCGAVEGLTKDHATPIGRGGDNSIGNVVPACFRCNGAKGADTAAEFLRRRLLGA